MSSVYVPTPPKGWTLLHTTDDAVSEGLVEIPYFAAVMRKKSRLRRKTVSITRTVVSSDYRSSTDYITAIQKAMLEIQVEAMNYGKS